jgi:predicted ATPase
LRDFASLVLHPSVTFFVGENGSGKSTLLEAIALAWGFSPEGGTRNANFSTAQTTSNLHEYLRLGRGLAKPRNEFFLRAESFFNLATYMDDIGYLDAYGGKSLHAQSHGESFMALMLHKFRRQGFFILDEPEAALSPARQLAALKRIDELVQEKSQLIIATHSPILLAYPKATIYQFSDAGIAPIAYEETAHYTVTRDFLSHYPKRLQQLFTETDDRPETEK